jgi:RNA polymerase sigma-70 factor (ECF subfamily)
MCSSEPAASRNDSHDPFATTRWSLVVAARGTDEASSAALADLAQAYWYPIYAFIRRRIPDVHAAQDLTQSFFERLLETNTIAAADRERGRFRAFLLTACKRFLANERAKARTVKRGGGVLHLSLDFELGESKYGTQAVDTLTPDRLFEQQWAITLLARVLDRLEQEMEARGKGDQFVHLKRLLSGAGRSGSIAAAARELGQSEGAVKVAAHRLRQRYRELLREEIAQTVAAPGEIDDEIRSLFAVLGEKD